MNDNEYTIEDRNSWFPCKKTWQPFALESFSESAISFGSYVSFLSTYLSFYILNSYHPDVDLISPRELYCVDKKMWQKICLILKSQSEYFVFSLKK